MSEPTTEVAQRALFSNDQMAELSSLADVMKMFADAGVEVEQAEDYGTGFEVLDNKHQLVNKPFGIIEWRFNKGDKGEFVSFSLMTKAGEKYVVNDGSTGICAQLRLVTEKREKAGHPHPQYGLGVQKGLRFSTYATPGGKDGETSTTFYLAGVSVPGVSR